MSTATAAESVPEVVQSPVISGASANGGTVSRSIFPPWVRQAARSFSRIRLPRFEGVRPEQAVMDLRQSSSAEAASPPVAEATGGTETATSPKSVSRRKVALPQGGTGPRVAIGSRALRNRADSPATAVEISPGTAAPTDSSQGGGTGDPESSPEEDFAMESLRFLALQLVTYKKILGKPTYLVDELEAHLVHPSSGAHHQMVAHDLAARLHNGGKEKPIDAVVCYNDDLARGPFFAHSLTEALLHEYGGSHEIALHILVRSPTASDKDEEYQLAGKWSASQHPLGGKRVLLAVPSITPHNWPSVSQQVLYLRGCVGHLRVVSIARIGRLPIQGRAGVQIEAFTSYGI